MNFDGDWWSLIPAEKVASMRQMTAKLRKKYPQWKTHRIMRKVAEAHHIKLIPDEPSSSKFVSTVGGGGHSKSKSHSDSSSGRRFA